MESEEVCMPPVVIRPRVHRKFNRALAEGSIRQIVLEELQDKPYDSALCGELTKRIGRRIHEALRGMPCDRYKFVVRIVLGEKVGQGLKCAGGCLWDDQTDCVVSTSLNLEHIYCVATVFAVYCYHYE